jgi:putative ABC transport system permease protein
MMRLAWKNLVHDRARLVVSLAGVTFAVFLMLLQSGVFFGFARSASAIVDQCPADIWLVSAGARNLEAAWSLDEKDVALVRGTPGVAWAHNLIHAFGYLRLKSGEGRWAQIFGFDPATGVGGPPEMVVGRVSDLSKPDTYIVDESSLHLLKGLSVGDRLENTGRRMELVGLSRGVKSYTTNPMLFTSFRTAQDASIFHRNRTGFIVARVEPGANVDDVVERLRHLDRFDVYRRDDFAGTARDYWIKETGIGLGMGITVVLGFVVGLVIVGQTMYAATVERIREYATLKALGATNLEVCGVIWAQAALLAAAGYVVGAAAAIVMQHAFAGLPIAVHLGLPLFAAMLGATLVMCFSASLLSVVRLLRVDPATVFRS